MGDTGEEQRTGAGGERDAAFRGHFGAYLLFGVFIFVLNLLTDPGSWWFYWPLFGWGIGIAAHAFSTYGADAPVRIVALLNDWLHRMTPGLHHSPHPPPRRPATSPRAEGARAHPDRQARAESSEFERILHEGEAKVDVMRREARRIPTPAVRSQALDVCASADRILGVLAENPDERSLAGDFLTRYLTPAEAIVRRYTRLATRGVMSAESTLAQVEREDFPLLDEKFRELYDRLHRGDLIDLAVAREMLQLDFATAGPGGQESLPRE